jgi:hypothetical protein
MVCGIFWNKYCIAGMVIRDKKVVLNLAGATRKNSTIYKK